MKRYTTLGGATTQGWLYDSMYTRLRADASKAKANLMVYFENPAGIGEHPDIAGEMYKEMQNLAAAEDALKALQNNFGDFAADAASKSESNKGSVSPKLDASELDSPEITP